MNLSYAPLVPREGMRGTFRALVDAWGDPNNWDGLTNWPKAVLAQVCERGEPKLVVYDRHAVANPVFYITPEIVAK